MKQYPVAAPAALPAGTASASPRIDPSNGGVIVSATVSGGATETTLTLLTPSPKFREYSLATINGGDVDLVSVGGAACRRIKVIGAGSLVLTPKTPISGDETLTVSDGDVLDIQANVIKSTSSGFTAVQVFW